MKIPIDEEHRQAIRALRLKDEEAKAMANAARRLLEALGETRRCQLTVTVDVDFANPGPAGKDEPADG